MSARSLRLLWPIGQNTIHKNIYYSVRSPESRLLMTSSNILKDERTTHSTVDSAEIQMFSQMKDWWNLNGPMRPLHSMNEIRVPFVRDGLVQSDEVRICSPLKGMKILDVGCGGGILSEGLARLGATVTGIDASKELVEIAIKHRDIDPKIAENKPDYIHTSIEDHAIKNANLYDGVIASEVIEHINNQELFVKSCIQVLKPNGRVFFTTPSKTRLSQFLVIWFAENIIGCLPKGTHKYEKFISVGDLSFLLEKYGCQNERTRGCFFNMLTYDWFWTENQLFFYALQAIKK